MEDLAQPLLDLIKAHSDLAAVIMFVTAFGESFAFISLLFPGTTVLIAAGTLMAAGTLPYAPVLIGAVAGAVLGDSISYWLGRRGRGALRVGQPGRPGVRGAAPVRPRRNPLGGAARRPPQSLSG